MVPEKEQRQRNEQDIHKEGCLALQDRKQHPCWAESARMGLGYRSRNSWLQWLLQMGTGLWGQVARGELPGAVQWDRHTQCLCILIPPDGPAPWICPGRRETGTWEASTSSLKGPRFSVRKRKPCWANMRVW